VFLSARRDGNNVSIEVRDEGEGIPSELLPRIFDVFTQGRQGVERSGGGLGLGLAIARSIVAAHRGAITAESAGAGRGATVTIRLPLVASGPAPTLGGEAVARAESGRHRILVVDDNADGAEMLSAFLDELGYETMIAANAEQALSLLERVVPAAAILDIGLPGMDGYELAAEMIRRFGDRAPPMLALTGYTQANDRERALAVGFAAHFGKPVDMVKLVATLERLLQTRPRTHRPSLN
jgi:CheY-like chemotaxis protein